MRRISAQRLPGRIASTGREDSCRMARAAESEVAAGGRAAKGCPTNRVVTYWLKKASSKGKRTNSLSTASCRRAALPSRQAQAVGATYCIVGTPWRLSRLAMGRLKSGASIPMKQSGGCANQCRSSLRRKESSRGRCATTSARPITESSSTWASKRQPAAAMASPPTPSNWTPGSNPARAVHKDPPS